VPEPSLEVLAAATALAAFVAGFLRGSLGGGIGLALTPVLTLALSAQSALGLTGFVLILADPIILRYYWRQWDTRQLRLLLPTTIVGILIGVWLISGLSDHRLRRLIGCVALALALLQLVFLTTRIRVNQHGSVSAGLGVLAGMASSIANSAGVILGPYLAGLGLSNAAVVATSGGRPRHRELPQGALLLEHRVSHLANDVDVAARLAIALPWVVARVAGECLLAAETLCAGADRDRDFGVDQATAWISSPHPALFPSTEERDGCRMR